MCRQPTRSSSSPLYIRRPSGAQRATRRVSRLVRRCDFALLIRSPSTDSLPPGGRRPPVNLGPFLTPVAHRPSRLWRPKAAALGRGGGGGHFQFFYIRNRSKGMATNVSTGHDVPGATRSCRGSRERSEPAATRTKGAEACAGGLRAQAQPHCMSPAERRATRDAKRVPFC